MRISKSKAKDLYLLNDSDLDTLDVIITENYMNNNNQIRLYNKDELLEVAIEKYGDIERFNKIKENRKLLREAKKKKIEKNKEQRRQHLLKYFQDHDYSDEDDILSEFPCYLYIEYGKNKFMKEVNNEINYNIEDIFNFSINRIKRRTILKNELTNKNLEYRVDSSIIDKYIDKQADLDDTIKLVEINDFYWRKTIYGILRRNYFKNLSGSEKRDLKEDVLYFHILTSKVVSFPDSLKNQVENILKTFIFLKDKNVNIELHSRSENIYSEFMNTIKLRNNIITHYRNSNNLPEFILNRISNNNNISISYE